MATGRTAHRLGVLAAAILFSTGGAAIKGSALTSWQIASFRSAIAALVLVLLVPSARKRWSLRMAGVGVAYAATMVLFVIGNKLTTAANTIFLQSTAPLYVLVLSPRVLGEPIRRQDLVAMGAIAGGLALFFVGLEAPSQSAPNPLLGNVLACAAGVSWAITLLGLRWLERREEGSGSGLAAVAVGNLMAALIALPWAFPVGAGSATDWGLVVYLGVIQIALAYVFLTYGFRGVPAFEASLIILVEPTLNPVWAWLFQGEVPGAWAIAGGIVILVATTLNGRRRG